MENKENEKLPEENDRQENRLRDKNNQKKNILVIVIVAAAAIAAGIITNKFYPIYWEHRMNDLDEYYSYTTDDGEYTISLRNKDSKENEKMNIMVFLVKNNENEKKVKYVNDAIIYTSGDYKPEVNFFYEGDTVDVKIVSQRPGEKLYEAFIAIDLDMEE